MSFENKVIQSGNQVKVTRKDLFEVCPHRNRALVASYGRIEEGICSIVLERKDFGPYLKGHPWLFPGHWQIEMIALAAGFQAKRDIALAKGWSEAVAYNLPMLISYGGWEKRPLAVDPNLDHPLIATVENIDMHIGGQIKYVADVRLSYGEKSALWEGITVYIVKGK